MTSAYVFYLLKESHKILHVRHLHKPGKIWLMGWNGTGTVKSTGEQTNFSKYELNQYFNFIQGMVSLILILCMGMTLPSKLNTVLKIIAPLFTQGQCLSISETFWVYILINKKIIGDLTAWYYEFNWLINILLWWWPFLFPSSLSNFVPRLKF